MNKQMRGVTLMEAMIAVSIIGILASLAAPNYDRYMRYSKVANQVNFVFAGLQEARNLAIKKNSQVAFTYDVTNEQWTIEGGGTKTHVGKSIKTIISPEGATTVTFSPLGVLSIYGNADGSPKLEKIAFIDKKCLASNGVDNECGDMLKTRTIHISSGLRVE